MTSTDEVTLEWLCSIGWTVGGFSAAVHLNPDEWLDWASASGVLQHSRRVEKGEFSTVGSWIVKTQAEMREKMISCLGWSFDPLADIFVIEQPGKYRTFEYDRTNNDLLIAHVYSRCRNNRQSWIGEVGGVPMKWDSRGGVLVPRESFRITGPIIQEGSIAMLKSLDALLHIQKTIGVVERKDKEALGWPAAGFSEQDWRLVRSKIQLALEAIEREIPETVKRASPKTGT